MGYLRWDVHLCRVLLQDCNGSTALMFAIKNKSSTASAYAVRTLITCGADVQLADFQGRTALHWAAQYNQPEVIDILVAASADLNVTDSHGDSAYVTAIKSNSPDALKHLIDAGCDRTMIDGLMGTAVSLAAVKVIAARFVFVCVCLQCFDTVGWAAGRASGL